MTRAPNNPQAQYVFNYKQRFCLFVTLSSKPEYQPSWVHLDLFESVCRTAKPKRVTCMDNYLQISTRAPPLCKINNINNNNKKINKSRQDPEARLTRRPWSHSAKLSAVVSDTWQRRLSRSSASISSSAPRRSSRRCKARRLLRKGEVGDWQSNRPLE